MDEKEVGCVANDWRAADSTKPRSGEWRDLARVKCMGAAVGPRGFENFSRDEFVWRRQEASASDEGLGPLSLKSYGVGSRGWDHAATRFAGAGGA